jgi:DNA-binding transcriptional LysR family regulator
MVDWNDLRHFLAVARFGSTLAAARALKVSQATVSRRVTLLEEALGIALFARQPSGYVLTARGAALVPLAEAVEEAVERFGDAVAAETRRLSGKVRLTTVESAANAWVIPAIARLHQANPEIEVEIVTSDRNLDLARGEADVAIRFGARPTEDMLVVRQIAELQECIYASRELVTRLGRPVDLAGIAAYPLVAEIEPDGWQSRWIAEHVPEARIVHRVSSLSGIIASIRAGIGAAALPCIMGDELKGLVRLLPPIEALTTPCWLVTTDLARRQPHIRALIDVVVAQVSRSLLRARTESSEALTA